MSARQVQIVLLCEDGQHEAFFRRFLEKAGWNKRQLTVLKSPAGRGSGAQWVIDRYPLEAQAIRSTPHIQRALVAVVDDDTKGRLQALDRALIAAGETARAARERILCIVPARNIETWFAWLGGQHVDETTAYPRLARERDCAPAVQELHRLCQDNALRSPAPPSLLAACQEYRTRMP